MNGREAAGPPLSVCLIAKNEEERLPVAIESVAPFAAEVVVVDTGSTDGTVAAARSHGARVIERPWRDDFSDARNHGLEAATGVWVLCLDADETLPEREGGKLRRLLEEKRADAWFVRLRSALADADEGRFSIHAFPRLFRNHPAHRFEGRVHEQILPSLERTGARVRFSDLTIDHSGYAMDRESRRRKLERNLRLLEMDREERPESALVLFHLGETHTLLGDPERAVEAYSGAIARGGLSADHSAATRQNLAAALLRLGRAAEAIEEAERAARTGAGSAVAAWLVLASARIRTGDPEGAVRDVDRYLKLCDRALSGGKTLLGFTPDRAKAHLLRGEALLRMGRTVEAEREAERVIRENDGWGGGHRLLGRAAAAREDWARAEESFRRALDREPDRIETVRDLAVVRVRGGDPASALAVVDGALRSVESADLVDLQARLRVVRGDLRGAVESYRRLAGLCPGSVEAHRRLAGLYHKLGDSEKAKEHLVESERCSNDNAVPHKISS